MKRSANGAVVRFTYLPIMNWVMMGLIVVGGLTGLVAFFMARGSTPANMQEIMNTMMMFCGAITMIGLVGGLSVAARAFEIDPRGGEVRVVHEFPLGARRKVYKSHDIAGLQAERVGGMGPEAYWLFLVLKSDKRVKVSPQAAGPEIAQEATGLVRTLSSYSPAPASAGARRGFGRAA